VRRSTGSPRRARSRRRCGSPQESGGFRNIAVHSDAAIDWAIVHAIGTRHLDDFREFARIVAECELQ